MNKRFPKLPNPSIERLHNARYSNPPGNVLLYVVVLMLIFGVLGVVMVSLFTSSTASTVTRNDTRRAIYLAESGMRYAFSELRKADFDIDFMIDTLNTTTYTVTDAGSFTINVFSPWYDSSKTQSFPADGPLTLLVPIGAIPTGYIIPPNNIYAINYEFVRDKPEDPGGWAEVSSLAGQTPTTIDLILNQVLNAGNGERICLAVKPTENRTITDGGNLYVSPEARDIFPRFAGAISIGRQEYFYEESIYDSVNNRVEFTNIVVKTPESSLPLDVTTADYVILSPRNYMAVPTGKSGDVEYGGNYLFGKVIYDASLIRPGSRKPDITADDLTSNLSEQETASTYFSVDTVADEIAIGGGSDQFGSAFFDANMSIGGDQDYCQQGACLFFLGVRVFFLLDFDDQGEGITFTLTNADTNNATSVGGDVDLSELLGYAGDSRTQSNGSTFLATAPADRGLDPPKIAVEFDTRTNSIASDPPPDYCADVNTVNSDSRNDPLAGDKDTVQYVFWGRTSFLNIPCRGNNTLYDDNRHDADGEEPVEEWRFEGATGPLSLGRPAIGPDGTIYISDQVNTLYALNEDGTTKWTFNVNDPSDYMPGVDPNTGTIYSDRSANKLVALNPDGTEKWNFLFDGDIDSTPVVGPDGTIFFGSDEPPNAIFALNPDGTERWRYNTGGNVDTIPALSPDGSVVYAVSDDDNLYAVNVSAVPIIDGTLKWQFPLTAETDINSSPIVNPSDGTIYVGSDDQNVYAINPDGTEKWRFNPGTGSDIESSPAFAIDPLDGNPTVYIGSDDNNVYAINAQTGAEKWRFDTGSGNVVSSPVIDLDGTIYVGSEDGNVYAINPDGTQKWFFPTGGPVQSSPALGQAGFIHIGSNDTNFYTISQFGDPRNFKDEDKSAGKLLTVEDLSSGSEIVEVDDVTDWLNGKSGVRGPYAVRLEVNRSLFPNPDGEFDYQLRLWLRQCNNDVDCDNILGTFFQDTRIEYDYSAVPATLPMEQRFDINAIDHLTFDRFHFGFTAATGSGQTLDATISQFQLSFIRPGDPVVTDDATSWPP